MQNFFFFIIMFLWVCIPNPLNLGNLSAKTLVIDGVGSHEENIKGKLGNNSSVSKNNIVTQTNTKKPIYSRILAPETLGVLSDFDLEDSVLTNEEKEMENESSYYVINETVIQNERELPVSDEDYILESDKNIDTNIGYDPSAADMMESVTSQVETSKDTANVDNATKDLAKNDSEDKDTLAMLNNQSDTLSVTNTLDTKNLTIYFEEDSVKISDANSAKILDFASNINSEIYEISINAYAIKKGDKTSAARRMSLSRALAVRKIFIQSGIPSENMQVRALGDDFESESVDKVEINFLKN